MKQIDKLIIGNGIWHFNSETLAFFEHLKTIIYCFTVFDVTWLN